MGVRSCLLVALVLIAPTTVSSAEQAEHSAFQQAQKLEQEGKSEEAFLKYLSVPGGEYAAINLARRGPEKFLKTLRTRADGVPVPRLKLIEGDLLLALGRKDDAVACYRQIVSKIAGKASDGWDEGFMPRDYYLVEPPANVGRSRPVQPFSVGPGSHRDAWLIRRFIALEVLELEHIDKGGFDTLSAAYRRGLAYEGCRKNAEAVVEYERVLSLPFGPLNLPDPDEEAVQGSMMSQMPAFLRAPGSTADRDHFQAEVLRKLYRLYGALGKTDKVVEIALRQFQSNPRLLENLSSLEQTARKLRTAGKEKQFLAWARKQIRATESHTARANLYWCLGGYKRCARELGQACKKSKDRWYGFEAWSERFRKLGKDELRAYLIEILEAHPDNARARLELLDLEDRFEGDEAIELLERLLDSDASFAFARGKGVCNRTRFRNYYDLAYRLMRLYEKQGEDEKISWASVAAGGSTLPKSTVASTIEPC